jgi:hypothetical protein
MKDDWKNPPMEATEWKTRAEIQEDEEKHRKLLLQNLKACEFNYFDTPKKPDPVLLLGTNLICTPGNISNIQAAAKAGKTAVVGAIIAAVLSDQRCDCAPGCCCRDATFGFTADNPKKLAFLHFDTEQSHYDHHAVVSLALDRAGVDLPPSWFHSFWLTNLPLEDRLKCIEMAIKEYDQKHKGVCSVIIDGIADLCGDPNNAVASFGLVDKLHRMAIEYECAIITVLHENPGSDSGKMRGHLGSQLERKAETALRLAKDSSSGITTIWTERGRHCHIYKHQGVCFRWDETEERHVLFRRDAGCQGKVEKDVADLFSGKESHTYKSLCDAIMSKAGVKIDAAKKHVRGYVGKGLILKGDDSNYTLVPSG